MDNEQFDKEIGELKDALEYQIDIVLRLEDERLLLSKENRIQKDKIKELSVMVEKYVSFQQLTSIEKCIQTDDQETRVEAIQTEEQQDDLETLTCSSMDLSKSSQSNTKSLSLGDLQRQELDILTETKTLLSKQTPKQQKISKLPQKSLKFCGDNYKENFSNQSIQQKDSKDLQLESMAKELLRLTKEIQQNKLQIRNFQETLKNNEKINKDLSRQLEVKTEMLEKIRKENAEMAILINESKYKSIRVIDQEMKKSQENCRLMQKQLESKCQENVLLTKDLQHFRLVLEKLTEQFEKKNNNVKEQSNQIKEEEMKQVHQIRRQEQELNIRDESITELRTVNEKLLQEVEYFRQISLKYKERYETQEKDLEFYRNLLITHNIIK